MDLYLRKVIHPQARDSYRVTLKGDEGLETEIGSIGIKQGSGATEAWVWAIDTVAWARIGRTDEAVPGGLGPARLTEFLQAKRKRL